MNSCEQHNWFTKQELKTILVLVVVARLTEKLNIGSNIIQAMNSHDFDTSRPGLTTPNPPPPKKKKDKKNPQKL